MPEWWMCLQGEDAYAIEGDYTVDVLILLGPLPIVTSAPLVSVPNPHLCALRLEFNCASSARTLVCLLVLF